LQETQSELEALRSAQLRLKRLAAMGEKAGTTAHELRNPLGVIATSMGVIEFKAGQADLDLDKPMERAHRAIRRCEHIIDEHLDRARARGHRPEPVVIDDWLSGLLADMEIGADTSLITDLKAHGVIAEIDQDSFRRILINLVDNAIQALSETTKQNTVTIGSLADDDGAAIYVEDNGPGIAPHLLDHVTEALFSTKPYGTGLGLPTVQRIIEEHGGSMAIESEPQRGTRVVLRLPRSRRL
jgi:signal transduction histidine kinase